jgi:hypothetical protein
VRTTFRTILSTSGLIAALGVVTLPPFAPGLVAQEPAVATDTVPTGPEGEAGAEKDADETGVEAGYEKNGWNGFFIRSKDGQFRLNIGAYTQIRYNMNWRTRPDSAHPDERDFSRGWDVPRTRFIFDGDFTDRVYYHLRMNINTASELELIAAFAQIGLGESWNVRVGRQWLALSREDWIYPQDLAAIEFSANDFNYAIWSSLGVQTRYQAERLRWWFALSNGAFGGRQGFPSSPESADGMVSSRLEYQLGGTDWSVWDDLIGRRGRASGVLLGVSGAYQGRNKLETETRHASQLNADVSVSGSGLHLFIAGSRTSRQLQTREWFDQYGFLAQGSVFVLDHTYLYGRFDGVFAGSTPGDHEDYTVYATGVGWLPFLWTNRWKVNLEVSYLPQAIHRTIVEPSGMLGFLPSDSPDQWSIRTQFQFGF